MLSGAGRLRSLVPVKMAPLPTAAALQRARGGAVLQGAGAWLALEPQATCARVSLLLMPKNLLSFLRAESRRLPGLCAGPCPWHCGPVLGHQEARLLLAPASRFWLAWRSVCLYVPSALALLPFDERCGHVLLPRTFLLHTRTAAC